MLETRERSNTLGSEDDAIDPTHEAQAIAALQKANANIQALKKFIAGNPQQEHDDIPELEEDVTYENKEHPKKDTAPQQRSMLDIKLEMLRNKQPKPKKKEDEVIDSRVAQAIQSHIARFGIQRTFLSSACELWNQVDALFECIRSGDNSLIKFQQTFTETLENMRKNASMSEGIGK